MLDFVRIEAKKSKNGTIIRPIFDSTIKSKDILIRSKEIYGIWNEDGARWDRTFEDAARLIDKEVFEFFELYKKEHPNESVSVAPLRDSTCPSSDDFVKYIRRRTSTDVVFDGKLIFKSDPYKREDYSTHRLDYDICEGSTEYYDKLMDTLYDKDERRKIEWFIGAIVNGDNAKIQKFAVFYGAPGTGKSTVLNIIERLFKGYSVTFESGAICSSRDQFSMAPFKNNPLVAIDHDGDLSHADTNTRMNSLVSHEPTRINEKNEKAFTISPLAILFIGTNEPVKITSSKSGILRRLIDINPSGRKLSGRDYKACIKHIEFELGAIAKHCKEVYLEDPDYYIDYRPTEMMAETNDFYDFMLTYYDAFANEDYVTLKVAWARYKEYCDDCGYSKVMPRRDFKHEIKNYFSEHETQLQYVDSNGKRQHASNAYIGFKKELFSGSMSKIKDHNDDSDTKEVNEEVENKDIYEGLPDWLHLKDSNECEANVFEKMFNDARAQYATTGENEVPKKTWNNDDGSFNVKTKLSDILLLNQVHYVLTQETEPSLIVIDFDRKDKDGKKSLRLNLEAASTFPRTYAEVSKGGQGLHLHYIYDGDVNELSRLYDDEIEIKVFKGLSALRRRLTLCNNEKIAHINSGLPLKGEKGAKMIDPNVVLNEKAIRTAIRRNLAKEYHADTTSSVHFIKKILDDAYASGEPYDVRDLRTAVMNFAAKATNQSQHCMELVMKMEFCSKDILENEETEVKEEKIREEELKPITFFDIEIFPNLFVICFKKQGEGGKEACGKMINPSAQEVMDLVSNSRLIGFNNLGYDNIILYNRILGKNIEELYQLSCDIISGANTVNTGKSNDVSYTDVYDFSNTKMSLKKWEIELDIHHQELGLRWDKPVPKELWEKVADYCCNDVVATEAVFNHLKADWNARQILASLSGLSVNDSTNRHSGRIIFGNNKHPQSEFIYTDLSKEFPGYEFCVTGIDKDRYIKDDEGKPIYAKGFSIYMGEDPSEGGYVYAEPGIHRNVALLDIASLHPTTIEVLKVFGEKYTTRFSEIKKSRIAIKHKAWDEARTLLGGALIPFIKGVEELSSEQQQQLSDDLAYAQKICINAIYGCTSAKFPNLFKDPRNIDNIVAKRGALFMITLKHEVQKRGYQVAHIKTDSIKIPNADDEMIKFVMEFGKKYGYSFEHEATYERMCLVNDAVYIAKYDEFGERTKGGRHANCWTATGAQFQIPYVFKTLFSHEQIEFKDICETKSVSGKGNIYLDMDEPMEEKRTELEKELSIFERQHSVSYVDSKGKKVKKFDVTVLEGDDVKQWDKLYSDICNLHDYVFVGRVGQFCPIKKGAGGGILLREADGKYSAVAGTKGYRWLESEIVRSNDKENDIDKEYYRELVDKAFDAIAKYGDAEEFING